MADCALSSLEEVVPKYPLFTDSPPHILRKTHVRGGAASEISKHDWTILKEEPKPDIHS